MLGKRVELVVGQTSVPPSPALFLRASFLVKGFSYVVFSVSKLSLTWLSLTPPKFVLHSGALPFIEVSTVCITFLLYETENIIVTLLSVPRDVIRMGLTL